jgi:hypothetical protein
VTGALNIPCEVSEVCDRGKGWLVNMLIQFPAELASQGWLVNAINSFDFGISRHLAKVSLKQKKRKGM